MVQAITFSERGAPEVFSVIDLPLAEPEAGQVTVRHSAIEVNFFDILQRRGEMFFDHPNRILGMSAVGYVEKLGAGVTHLNIGDRVCYFYPKYGCYAAKRNIPATYLINVAESRLEDHILAGSIVKGLTAHFLALRAHVLNPNKVVLIHSAAGGVGQVLAKFANLSGCYVIGTVSDDGKRDAALNAGCHTVFNRKTENWVEEVKKLTQGYGVTVAYDGIGKDTLEGSMDAMTNIGVLLHYGSASGDVATINAQKIASKSLFYTRPHIFHYKAERQEYLLSMNDVLMHLESGNLIPQVTQFSLSQASDAHKWLESGGSTGSIVLIP